MAACVKTCCILNYVCGAAAAIKQQLGYQTGEIEILNGPLNDHINRVARNMGIKKNISLRELRPIGGEFGIPSLRNVQDLILYGNFSSFGNSLCSRLKAGVVYRKNDVFDASATRFFLTRKVAELKTNHNLWGNLISFTIAIATTILLAPTFPIAAYFIGFAAGGIAGKIFVSLNERKIDRLTMENTTNLEKRHAITALEKMKNASPFGKAFLSARLSHLRSLITRAAPQ